MAKKSLVAHPPAAAPLKTERVHEQSAAILSATEPVAAALQVAGLQLSRGRLHDGREKLTQQRNGLGLRGRQDGWA